MIPVIAVFAIAVIVCAMWSKAGIQRERDQRLAEDRVQVSWLAEAGLRRGASRWTEDSQFTGETWEIAASDIDRPSPASVEIQIEPADDLPGAVRIVARARYPAEHPRVSQTKSLLFKPASLEPAS